MKRKFTAAVLCALILGAFPISASAHSIDAFASTNDGRIMGDLDNDGSVTSTDALIALRISVGLTEETSEYNAFGDMDHDGSVTSTDALLILRKSVGLPIGDSTDISANVIGDWTYSPSDGVFTNVTLNKDGASNLQSTLFAAWRTEGSDVIVTVYGEDNVYTYTNDTLVSKSDPSVVYTRGTTEADISKLIPGDWTYSPSDGVFTNVTLNKDVQAICRVRCSQHGEQKAAMLSLLFTAKTMFTPTQTTRSLVRAILPLFTQEVRQKPRQRKISRKRYSASGLTMTARTTQTLQSTVTAQ